MPSSLEPSHRPSTRRDFLKEATAVAAGGLVLPRALGSPRRAPRGPNETIGFGVIGVGGMGGAHCEAILKLVKEGAENVEIRALSDVCKPRLDNRIALVAAGQKRPPEGHRHYQDLLARKDIDAVLIASPEHWHAQMAIDAIAAGKDVYVEKPMTLNLEDAMRLAKAARASDRVVEVGTQYVTDPKYGKAREFIANGSAGKLVTSETGYYRNSKNGEWHYAVDPAVVPGDMLDWKAWCGPLGDQPWDTLVYHQWRRYRKFSTGIVGDLLVHQMTPLMHTIDQGWPVRVVAVGGHHVDMAMENFDQVNLLVQFETGHTMTVSGSTCNANGPAPIIRGHKGSIHLSGNNCRFTPEKIWADELDPDDSFKGGGDSHDKLRLDFLACCRERRTPLSTVDLGLKVMVVVDLAARSMWEGKAFTFDPASLSAKAM